MKKTLLLAFTFCATISLSQSDAYQYDAGVPNHYFNFSLKLVRETPGFSPPVAARAFGFMGLALYEAIVPGIPDQISTQGKILDLTQVTLPNPGSEYHWPTVANNALSMIVDSLFRTTPQANKDSLNAIRTYYNDLFQSQLSQQIFDDSRSFGEAIARDIFDYSRTDGGHNAFAENFPLDYMPPVGESYWVPFGNQLCLQPYWGSHRPFIESDTAQSTLSPDPPEFSTEPGSDFFNFALEVYNTAVNLTPEEEDIALFWADGMGTITPPGHSISMLHDILVAENSNLAIATIAYTKLGIGVSDAFLACWKTKYIYNLCRPVTYIRQFIDTTWSPLIVTPPFPEYPSGHSSQSGAMAAVMTNIFGDHYAFTDHTHGTDFGGPRHFESFQEAAEEAAVSRLYGGIHFEFGNMAGLAMGSIVGANVNSLFEQLNVATEEVYPVLSNLILYPNPASDHITFAGDHHLSGASYVIYDVTGRVKMEGVFTADKNVLPVKSLVPGLYFILVDKHNPKTYRFTKS